MNVREQVPEEEWALREDLAACFRLIDIYGMGDMIYTHVSVRLPGKEDCFLINPYGLLFEEITASSLLKIDLEGNKLLESEHDCNRAGFIIHSCIHQARHDIQCALHTHSDYSIAVSIQKEGVKRISQFSGIPLASIAYHDYEGIATRPDEQERIKQNLGDKRVLILRNHGAITLGKNIGQAFELMYLLERACKVQILAQSGGEELIHYSDEAQANVIQGARDVTTAPKNRANLWGALRRKLDREDPTYKQ